MVTSGWQNVCGVRLLGLDNTLGLWTSLWSWVLASRPIDRDSGRGK